MLRTQIFLVNICHDYSLVPDSIKSLVISELRFYYLKLILFYWYLHDLELRPPTSLLFLLLFEIKAELPSDTQLSLAAPCGRRPEKNCLPGWFLLCCLPPGAVLSYSEHSHPWAGLFTDSYPRFDRYMYRKILYFGFEHSSINIIIPLSKYVCNIR